MRTWSSRATASIASQPPRLRQQSAALGLFHSNPGLLATQRQTLQRKCDCAGHADTRQPSVPSSALRISQPGDAFEQEADRVAEHVMRMPGPVEPAGAGSSIQLLQPGPDIDPEASSALMRKGLRGGPCESSPDETAEQEDEETAVMAKRDGSGPSSATPTLVSRLRQSREGGAALPASTRGFMEARFGFDFSHVRVHADSNAADMARAMHAAAFTFGNHIYFNEARYAPATGAGSKLLAHELAHVIQQTAGRFQALAPARQTVLQRAGGGSFVQPYRLNGFPPAEEAAMNAAIPIAISKVKSCSKLSWWGRRMTRIAIDDRRYDYKPDLGLCGWTFPGSWYIEIGKDAFVPATCCDLASTIAHEASHTQLYTEGRARKLECNCFGCSC